ncbi:hypothetical protein Phpb_02012 [Photorhabdus namnaonensis]|uniref:Uncharacterized protein n=1 Tax=Photorhabdus namnaonensis TaxID=1851568 RepID=A0A1B8YIC1_9GAMM|nr:hypothetical protein Phpb_02012 [Photorhabdus namnaonensis]
MLRIPSPQTFPPATLSLDKLIHNERNPVIFNEVCQRPERVYKQILSFFAHCYF